MCDNITKGVGGNDCAGLLLIIGTHFQLDTNFETHIYFTIEIIILTIITYEYM
jgi:hypothetical protein